MVHLEAAYRGSREYFHSTDLYGAITSALQAHGLAAASLDLKLRDRITTVPTIEFAPGIPESVADAAAVASAEVGNDRWTAVVRAGTTPITARKPYDEGPIWAQTVQDGRAFTAEGCDGFAPIEVATAVAVHAHRLLLPPPAGKRWMLAQLTIGRLLEEEDAAWLRYELTRQLGAAVTQGTLRDRQGTYGKMLFILQ